MENPRPIKEYEVSVVEKNSNPEKTRLLAFSPEDALKLALVKMEKISFMRADVFEIKTYRFTMEEPVNSTTFNPSL